MAKQAVRKSVTGETKRRATPRKTTTKATCVSMPTEDQIRARAYEIYLRRNGAPGDAHADWLQAERELMQSATEK